MEETFKNNVARGKWVISSICSLSSFSTGFATLFKTCCVILALFHMLSMIAFTLDLFKLLLIGIRLILGQFVYLKCDLNSDIFVLADNMFRIDERGRIYSLKALDHETSSEYILYITAEPGHKRQKRGVENNEGWLTNY